MQDLLYIFGRNSLGTTIYDDTDGARALFAWLGGHWEAMRAKLPGTFGATHLVEVIGGSCSKEERDAEVAFFEPRVKGLEGTARAVAEGVERATSCSEVRAHAAPTVAKYFSRSRAPSR